MNTISISQINTFLQCPYAYYLIYQLKVKTPKTDGLFFGSAIHHAIEQFYRGNDPVSIVDQYLHSDPHYERPVLFDIEKHAEEGKALMELYKTKGLYLEPTMLEERRMVELAHPLTGELLPMPFSFKFDVIANEYLIDHKTTKGNGLKQDDLNRNQGLAYFLAYRTIFGKPPRGFIQNSLVRQKTPKIIPIILHYSVDEEVWFWNLARKVIDMIDRKEYLTARPMIKTFYPCPVKDICNIHGT